MVFRLLHRDEIHAWYLDELSEAFVENERKPLADILRLRDGGRYELWGLFEDKQMLGYATVWKAKGTPLVLLDYLGVTKMCRSRGLGSYILTQLKTQGRSIITEAELPNSLCSANGTPLRS